MEDNRWTIPSLAKAAKLKPGTLRTYLDDNDTRIPGVHKAIALAHALKVTVEHIFADSDQAPTLDATPSQDASRNRLLAVSLRSIATTLNGVADVLSKESGETLAEKLGKSFPPRRGPRRPGPTLKPRGSVGSESVVPPQK